MSEAKKQTETRTVKRVAAAVAREWAATSRRVRWGAYIMAAMVLFAALAPSPASTPKTTKRAPKATPVSAPSSPDRSAGDGYRYLWVMTPWGLPAQIVLVRGLRVTQAYTSNMNRGQFSLILLFRGSQAVPAHCTGHDRVEVAFALETPGRATPAGVSAWRAVQIKWGSTTYFAESANAPWNIAIVGCGLRQTDLEGKR